MACSGLSPPILYEKYFFLIQVMEELTVPMVHSLSVEAGRKSIFLSKFQKLAESGYSSTSLFYQVYHLLNSNQPPLAFRSAAPRSFTDDVNCHSHSFLSHTNFLKCQKSQTHTLLAENCRIWHHVSAVTIITTIYL